MTHADHPTQFDATCPDCWRTQVDPPAVDDETWRYRDSRRMAAVVLLACVLAVVGMALVAAWR